MICEINKKSCILEYKNLLYIYIYIYFFFFWVKKSPKFLYHEIEFYFILKVNGFFLDLEMHVLHLVGETGVGVVSTFEHTSLVMALGARLTCAWV